MKNKLVEEIDSRWDFKNRIISVYFKASVLDPCFKQLSFLDDAQRDEAYIVVAQLADRLSARRAPTVEPEDEEQVLKKQKTDKEKEIAMLLCRDDEEEFVSTEGGTAKEEMRNYLQDKTKDDSGPLGWWEKN